MSGTEEVEHKWTASAEGESWMLEIGPDSFDGNRLEIAVYGEYVEGAEWPERRTSTFIAWPSPEQARAIAAALNVRADEVEADNEGKAHDQH